MTRKFSSILLHACAIFFSWVWAAGAEGVTAKELMRLDLEDILSMPVTVATITPKALREVPAAVSVITAQDIAHSGYRNIWDLLRNQPGVNVFQMSGNFAGVGIRGFNDKYSNKLQVLLDGRSIFNPVTQGVYWSDQAIMLEDIERIEIMRGPNSVLYGFNSFDGVINIVTKDPGATQGAMAKYTYGGHETHEMFGRFGDTNGPFQYRLSYQRENSRGLGENDGREILDSRRLNALNLRSRYEITKEQTLEVLAGGKFGMRGGRPVATADEDIATDYQIGKYSQMLSDDSGVNLQLSRTYWNVDRQGLSGKHNLQYRQYDAEVQHYFRVFERHSIVWGGGFRRNESRHANYKDPNNDYHDTILRGFFQDAIRITDRWTYYSGVEWERNNFTGADWSLRQTAMFNLFADHYLRLTYGRAYHAHSFLEYYFNIPFVVTGNPNLERESIDAFEIGYRCDLLEKKLFLDVEFFYNDVNKIRRSAGTSFDNGNEAEVNGVETSLEFLPVRWLKAYFNHSYLNVDDRESLYDTMDPRHKVNLGATFFWDRAYLPDTFDIRWSYVGSIKTKPADSPGAAKTKVSQYFKLDVKAAKKFLKDSLEVAVTGLNLLEDDHFEFGSEAAVPREVLLSVTFEF